MIDSLNAKHAVIYGGGGKIGAAVARRYAEHGALVHLVGRSPGPLEQVAAEIGPAATATVLDVCDEQAVEDHLATLPRLDVSFNLTSRGDVHGRPLTELATAGFMAPIVNGLTANFITSRAAARKMSRQQPQGGVIIWIGSGSSTGAGPNMGGTGPADAATDNLMRQLARETGAQNIRVCGIWTAGVPETFADGHSSLTPAQIDEMIGRHAALGRAPRLHEVTSAALFLASEQASGLTGTVLNVTAGLVSER